MRISRDFEAHHVLADGTRVTLRCPRAEDRDGMRRAFERLSPESRYRRFLHAQSALSDAMLRYLLEIDGVDHFAVIATTESLDLKEEMGLGVARFIRLKDEPTVAEAAVAVVDDMQHKGLGRLLLAVLTEAARERDVHTFRGEVLAENEPMRRILEEAGAGVVSDGASTLVFDVPLDVEDAPREASVLRRMLRIVAESFARARGTLTS